MKIEVIIIYYKTKDTEHCFEKDIKYETKKLNIEINCKKFNYQLKMNLPTPFTLKVNAWYRNVPIVEPSEFYSINTFPRSRVF